MTQQVSHRPIKCQSRSWSQRGTKVNGSNHGDNPLLKPTGIQIATKPLPGPTNREHRKLIGAKPMSSGTNYTFYCLECVCVCFLPIHSGHQVRWTYQPGSHRRKVTQDFSSTFFLHTMDFSSTSWLPGRPATYIFNYIDYMPNKWRTIHSIVHKIRLHGRRQKETAESLSGEKVRQAPQKEGG